MASPLKRDEQAVGLKAFAMRYFHLEITDGEALDALNLLDTGHYASKDLAEIVRKLRLRH